MAKKTENGPFYALNIKSEKNTSDFYQEYVILQQSVEAVNNFFTIYKVNRDGAKGPSHHWEQDIFRSMLVFACAGLDVLAKQLVKTKLKQIIEIDKNAQEKFAESVQKGIGKDSNDLIKIVAFALVESNPRDFLLQKYIEKLVGDSLQSFEQLKKVSESSGLNSKEILSKKIEDLIRPAFKVRNEIIHEMDINITSTKLKSPGNRIRRQRKESEMEQHTKNILELSESLFSAFKLKLGVR